MKKITNHRSQITNKFQILKPKFQKFGISNFGHWRLFVICCLVLGILIPAVAGAQGFTGNLRNFPGSALDITILIRIVRQLACYFIRFGMISVGVAIIVYGYMFLSSRGNPQGFASARKSLTWGLVGGLVIFGVFTIILTVSDLVGYGVTNYTGYPILTIVQCS